jgi:hypothetical protein
VFAKKDGISAVGSEAMRKLTMTEHRIPSVLRKLPGQTIPVESIASESGLTVKKVWNSAPCRSCG